MIAAPPVGHTVIAAVIIVRLNDCLFAVITADKYAHDFICRFSGGILSPGIRPVQLIDAHHKLLRADLLDNLTGFPIFMVSSSSSLRLGYGFLAAFRAAQDIVAFWPFNYRKLLAIGTKDLRFRLVSVIRIKQIVRHDISVNPVCQV